VDRRHVARCLVADEDRHAVGHPDADGGRVGQEPADKTVDQRRPSAADERIGFTPGRLCCLDRLPPVHLTHLHNERGGGEAERCRESGICFASLGKRVREPSRFENRRFEASHRAMMPPSDS
jgi:hypothetical protein